MNILVKKGFKTFLGLSLSGSSGLLSQFKEFVKLNIDSVADPSVRQVVGTYGIHYYGKTALAIIRALYGDKNVTSLDRKMKIAQVILEKYKDKI